MAGKTLDNIPPFTAVLTSGDIYDAERNPTGTIIDKKALSSFTGFLVADDTVKLEKLNDGVIRVSAEFDAVLKTPVIEKVTSVDSGKENEITSRGSVIVEGSNLLWDDSQPDEGFFINLMGIETKMTVVTPDPDGKRVEVKAKWQAMTPGDKPDLYFYYGRQLPLSDGGYVRGWLNSQPPVTLTAIEGGVEESPF